MSRTITKEQLSEYPVEEFAGKIIVIQTQEDADRAIDYLYQFDTLGFDTETRPAFKKGNIHSVALLQLASKEVCMLFRLNRIGFPAHLVKLLSDPEITKVGLSLRDDFQAMSRRIKFTPKGFLDLQKIVGEHDIADISLQKIYALLFNKKISKSQRLSNWEIDTLSEAQKKYAALDAWACLKIYEELCPTKNCF